MTTTAETNKHIESLFEYLVKVDSIFSDNYVFKQTIKILFLTNRLQNLNNDGFARIGWQTWDSHYQHMNYSKIERSLVVNKILESDYGYTAPNIAINGKTECRKFKLNKSIAILLRNIKRDDISRFEKDKQFRHGVQKVKSRNISKSIEYNDLARQSIEYNINNSRFNIPKLLNIAASYPIEKELFNLQIVWDLITGDYKPLDFNDSDGRIPNPLTWLSKEMKEAKTISGYSRVAILDISNCHLSCFGGLIRYIHNEVYADFLPESATMDKLDSYVNINIKYKNPALRSNLKESNCNKKQPSWASPPLSLGKMRHDLNAEIESWNSIFLNKSSNPKAYLSNLLDIKDMDKVKKICFQYINGCKVLSKPHKALDQWLKKTYPCMYQIWNLIDRKDTGCAIGRLFESKLMLDGNLYAKAKELNMYLEYENDGFSIYAENNKHIPDFISYLEEKSVELLGFKLIFKDKYNFFNLGLDPNQFALDSLLNSPKYEQYNEKLEKLQSLESKARRHMFALRKALYNKGMDVEHDDYHAVSEASQQYAKCKQALRLYVDKHKDMIQKIEALKNQLN